MFEHSCIDNTLKRANPELEQNPGEIKISEEFKSTSVS